MMILRSFLTLSAFLLLAAPAFAAPANEETILRPPSKPAIAAPDKRVPRADKVLFEGAHVGTMQSYTTKYEDTLVDIARRYDLGFVELRAANPNTDPWLPGVDVVLKLPTMHLLPDGPRQGIVINLPEMRLYAYVKKGQPPLTFPIGVGREGLATPLGTTTVVNKKEKPTWRPTARMRKEDPTLPEAVPPGPENPLGDYIMYLGWPEYGMHGTNKPYGVGRRVSSGCIRLYPEDVAKLYPLIPVGTPVTTVDQPVKVAWVDDDLYLEAHTSLAQANKIEQEGGIPFYEMTAQDMQMIMKAAGDYADRLDWDTIRRVIRERPGYPVPVASKKPPREAAAETPRAGKDPS